jgi:phosphotransferase system HPr-like phosphotransfer protein
VVRGGTPPPPRFVQVALAHPAGVRLRKGGRLASGKSVLALLTLGMKCHDVVTVEIDGEDERVLDGLEAILGHAAAEDAPVSGGG